MKVPPNKPNTQDRKYDSVVDDVENPTIFVVFKDTSSYPHYLVTYIF